MDAELASAHETELAALREQNARLRSAIRELIADSGTVFQDERIDYIEVQMSKGDWNDACKLVGLEGHMVKGVE